MMRNADLRNESRARRLDPPARPYQPDAAKVPGDAPTRTFTNPGDAAATGAALGERGTQAFPGGAAAQGTAWRDAASPPAAVANGVAAQAGS